MDLKFVGYAADPILEVFVAEITCRGHSGSCDVGKTSRKGTRRYAKAWIQSCLLRAGSTFLKDLSPEVIF
jgi:hypothetical protein